MKSSATIRFIHTPGTSGSTVCGIPVAKLLTGHRVAEPGEDVPPLDDCLTCRQFRPAPP